MRSPDAFTLGLASAFRFGAVIAVAGLLLALLLIRDPPPADEAAPGTLDR